MNKASGTDHEAVPCIASKQATKVSKEVQFESEISVFSIFLWMNYIVKSDPEEPSNIP